jgi:hypothetical protein
VSKVSAVARLIFTRRGVVGLLAAVAGAGSLGVVGVSQAGAVVNNNGLYRAYTNVNGTGCQVVVGDQKSPNAAVGEVDVTRCSHYYNLDDYVRLEWSTSANGPWHALGWYANRSTNYQLDTATSGFCGSLYWRTAADISFNNGQTFSGLLYSLPGYYATACR